MPSVASMLPLGVFGNQVRAEQNFGVLSFGGRAQLMAMPVLGTGMAVRSPRAKQPQCSTVHSIL